MGRAERRGTAVGIALVLAVALIAGPASGGSWGGGRYKQWVRRIAPGLILRRIVDYQTPRRIFVLTVDPSKLVTMDVALAQDQLPGLERTTSMAARHGAIAAINGDFGSGRPKHAFAEDGDLKQTGGMAAAGFAVTQGEQDVFIGHPQASVSALEVDSGETWDVARWNKGPPHFGQIVGFTAAGGDLEMPPPFACSARLLPTGAPQLADPDPGVISPYAVDQTGCSGDPMAPQGGVVLSAQPTSEEAMLLLSLSAGETVRIAWSFGGWPGIFDAIGGMPLLVSDGQVALGECTISFCLRHPRTGVGVTPEGRLLLVVVGGRQPGYSVGMSLEEFARLFLDLGATFAMNLDGGGSSTMVVKGKVVNQPSDGTERLVSSAILVLPGADLGEPALAAAVAPQGSRRARLAMLRDGGSLGGLLDELAQRKLKAGAVGSNPGRRARYSGAFR